MSGTECLFFLFLYPHGCVDFGFCVFASVACGIALQHADLFFSRGLPHSPSSQTSLITNHIMTPSSFFSP